MADNRKVRIGLQGARELELEVSDADEVKNLVNNAIGTEGVVWLVDSKGNEHGLIADKLAFVEIDANEKSSNVGFGSAE